MKRLIVVAVRSSICNFRCHYCYLNQKPVWFQNKQIEYTYSPEHVRKCLSKKRLGGECLFNFCADGETLLAKDITKYVKEILLEGHYVEFVTNLSITNVLNEMLSWDISLLERLEFKCSFHYLQLKEKKLLNVFADNVHRIWERGASACIEITPDDELIPYIDEVKEFSLKQFGALPHLSIARNDKKKHDFLTQLSLDEYRKTWSVFDSDFWKFKMEIVNKKINSYCFAGRRSVYIDLATGSTTQCYRSRYNFNIFENPNDNIQFCSIGKCIDSYCYNGHAFLTCGVVPSFLAPGYGDIRNRVNFNSGQMWINNKMLTFMNTKIYNEYSNAETIEDIKKDKHKMRIVNLKAMINKIKRKH